MKILSIGNSFSQDAHRYFNRIATMNGKELMNANLSIGGCTLKKHYLNMLDNESTYLYDFKSETTGLLVSIKDALKSADWDYVTLQQASHESFIEDSYTPYIEKLCDYIKLYSPKAKIYLHQTWAYPAEKERLREVGFEATEDMFKEIRNAYRSVYKRINADGIILSGEAMLKAYELKKDYIYRDAIHAGIGFGRYLIALVWYQTFFGDTDDFKHLSEFAAPISKEELSLAWEIAAQVKQMNKEYEE